MAARVDVDRQLAAARALAEGASLAATCRQSGVSRTALLRLRGDDAFRRLVDQARERLVERLANA